MHGVLTPTCSHAVPDSTLSKPLRASQTCQAVSGHILECPSFSYLRVTYLFLLPNSVQTSYFLAISPKHHALKEFVSMSVSPVGLGLLKALSQSLACSRYSKHVYWADLIMIIYRVSIIISWFLVPAEFLADSFCKGKKGGFTLRLSTALV